MKMREIIDKVSQLYRTEEGHVNNMRAEYNEVVKQLSKADYERGENITLAEYQYLKARKTALQQGIDAMMNYIEGISEVRELLMDLGFDTEVK